MIDSLYMREKTRAMLKDVLETVNIDTVGLKLNLLEQGPIRIFVLHY